MRDHLQDPHAAGKERGGHLSSEEFELAAAAVDAANRAAAEKRTPGPRRKFMDAASRAGFSPEQASFLWGFCKPPAEAPCRPSI